MKLVDDAGNVTDTSKALNCPFCGSKPIVTPFANSKGAFAECSSDTCALWGFKTDLNEWNHRTLFTTKCLDKYFFEPSLTYPGDGVVSVKYKCKCCRKQASLIPHIRHTKNCEVAKLLKAMP